MTWGDVIGIVLLVVATGELVLAAWFFLRYRQTATNWYGLFTIGVSLYTAANGLGYTTGLYSISERFGWVGGVMTAAFILPFSYTFPIKRKTTSELMPSIVWPLALFLPGILLTNLFIVAGTQTKYDATYKTVTGDYFWLLILFFLTYWIWGLSVIYRSFVQSNAGLHARLKIVFLSLIITICISTTTDIVLPLLVSSEFGYIGSLCSAFWLLGTSYIIVRK